MVSCGVAHVASYNGDSGQWEAGIQGNGKLQDWGFPPAISSPTPCDWCEVVVGFFFLPAVVHSYFLWVECIPPKGMLKSESLVPVLAPMNVTFFGSRIFVGGIKM